MSNTNALSAKDRIAGLVDENSFVEIGAGITKRSTDFNIQSGCIRTEWNNWRDARKKNCTYL